MNDRTELADKIKERILLASDITNKKLTPLAIEIGLARTTLNAFVSGKVNSIPNSTTMYKLDDFVQNWIQKNTIGDEYEELMKLWTNAEKPVVATAIPTMANYYEIDLLKHGLQALETPKTYFTRTWTMPDTFGDNRSVFVIPVIDDSLTPIAKRGDYAMVNTLVKKPTMGSGNIAYCIWLGGSYTFRYVTYDPFEEGMYDVVTETGHISSQAIEKVNIKGRVLRFIPNIIP